MYINLTLLGLGVGQKYLLGFLHENPIKNLRKCSTDFYRTRSSFEIKNLRIGHALLH